MCGIIAYVGKREVRPILIDGLSRLEYRGYDSAGIATLTGGEMELTKKAGRITELARAVAQRKKPASIGISHTRWATHGEPTDVNAHPHLDQSGKLALVHNGVIENYQVLKKQLTAEGHEFKSATDTEALSHLIGKYYAEVETLGDEKLVEAVRLALRDVKGTYGIAVMHQDHPGLIIGARRGSPLVLGIGEGEMFICSDATPLLPYTQKVVYLKDFDLVQIRESNFSIETLHEGEASWEIKELDFAPEAAERGDFPHFMLKEIYEQPTTIENAIRGRLNEEESSAQLGGLNLTPQQLREIDRIFILGCGTALHAGMVGKHMLEDMAFIPTETDYASEFRYRNCPVPKNSLFFVISQSGETADTLGALREARRRGFRGLGICNNVGSTIARESDGGVYMHAGPEIGVAATKSFVSQCAIFGLLTLVLGRMRHMSAGTGKEIIEAFNKLPGQITKILQTNEKIEAIAHKYCQSKSMLFLGRDYNYPIALEAALKMKEISYIHAAGFPTAELKHGVIALIDEETPCVFICPQDVLHEKNISNMQEVKARKGRIIAVATEGDKDICDHADDVIYVPRTIDMLQPILNIIPLQLLSYYTAVALGRDVDKPRNLAKSVTVE